MRLSTLRVTCLSVAALSMFGSFIGNAQTDGLASRPPMGWNSWNHFHRNVDDAAVRAQADAMVSSGMRDAGYVYVNIDDTWQGERDAQGNIQANSRFPDMKALADYVHSKGLKIGIYSSPGALTCAKFAGSLGHEVQDARTYAAWGMDYLKYDLCGLREQMKVAATPEEAHKIMFDAYIKMRDALKATGRPIVYSLCQYGNDAVWRWGTEVGGNLWRTTGDISDKYSSMEAIGFSQAGLAKFAGPGHWNDPDMLEVGNGGMNADEYRTHMSLWAILAAPLLAGNDLSTMTAETKAMLTNRDVIAVDQDAAGKQGDRAWVEGPLEIWVRQLADGSKAVGVFNRHPSPLTTTVDFKALGFTRAVKARDIWQGKDMGTISAPFTAKIPGHGVLFLKVSQ
ncbi:alpha-galactosidase [Edaphobacter aggregans]|uniref:Alpha-galactosidase n=1 Tax=Edaphobacter aggregans TaxID=570835 RepID=A0A428MF15_9BACT|nr:glycoside hydrolase family 27 protein [Edaphobacter aggregans]RSL15521.1 alpha-galactosidase [Edaphobacter aggregans]